MHRGSDALAVDGLASQSSDRYRRLFRLYTRYSSSPRTTTTTTSPPTHGKIEASEGEFGFTVFIPRRCLGYRHSANVYAHATRKTPDAVGNDDTRLLYDRDVLSYMARQTIAWSPLSLMVATATTVYLLVQGEWQWAVVIAAFAALGGLQFLFARWWIRTGEENDAREWLRRHPEHDLDFPSE
jgi:hypothetical protein